MQHEIFDDEDFKKQPLDVRFKVAANYFASEIQDEEFDNLMKPSGEVNLSYNEDQQTGFEDRNMTPTGQTSMQPVMVEDVETKMRIKKNFFDKVVNPTEEELKSIAPIEQLSSGTLSVADNILHTITDESKWGLLADARDYLSNKIQELPTGTHTIQYNEDQPVGFEDVQQTPQGQTEFIEDKNTDYSYTAGKVLPYVGGGIATAPIKGLAPSLLTDSGISASISFLENFKKQDGLKQIVTDVAIDTGVNLLTFGTFKALAKGNIKNGDYDRAAQQLFGKNVDQLDPEELSKFKELEQKSKLKVAEETAKLDDNQKAAIEEAANYFDNMAKESEKKVGELGGQKIVETPAAKPEVSNDTILFTVGDNELQVEAKKVKESTDRILYEYTHPQTGKVQSIVENKNTGEIETLYNRVDSAEKDGLNERTQMTGMPIKKAAAQPDTAGTGQGTQEFFGNVAEGNNEVFKPAKPFDYDTQFTDPTTARVKESMDSMKGQFDEHIATSIPTFRDTQVEKGSAIVKTYPDGASMIDLGGSEGGFVKAITKESGGKIRTTNLDASSVMMNKHMASGVDGSAFEHGAFQQGWEAGDTWEAVPTFTPKEKYDVVHESMMFQFIEDGGERASKIDEVADKYLKEDGLFITEEKFKLNDDAVYKQNEKLKENHKNKYYTKEQQNAKTEEVLIGMSEHQANYDQYLDDLHKRFDYVGTYWTSGNFRGIVASNSQEKFNKFMSNFEAPAAAKQYTYKKEYMADDIVEGASAADYAAAMRKARVELRDKADLVTPVSEAEAQKIIDEGGTLFTTKDGKAGAYVTGDGYMGGLFRNPTSDGKAAAKILQEARIKHGGKLFDSFANNEELYIRNGWKPVARMKFNPEYAPAGWEKNKELQGRPDNVFFVYDPKGSQKAGNGAYFDDYDEAYAFTLNYGKSGSNAKEIAAAERVLAFGSKDLGGALGGLTLNEAAMMYDEQFLGRELTAQEKWARRVLSAAGGAYAGRKFGGTKNSTNIFVGAKADEAGAFSNIHDRKVRKWIDDSKAEIGNRHRTPETLLPKINDVRTRKALQDWADGKIKNVETVDKKIDPYWDKLEADYRAAIKNDDPALDAINEELDALRWLYNKNFVEGRFELDQTFDLSSVLKHDDLYKQYPELKKFGKLQITFTDLKDGVKGSFDGRNQIKISSEYVNDPDKIKSIILHEVQHKIQAKEGWARGGSPEEFSDRPLYIYTQRRSNKIKSLEEWTDVKEWNLFKQGKIKFEDIEYPLRKELDEGKAVTRSEYVTTMLKNEQDLGNFANYKKNPEAAVKNAEEKIKHYRKEIDEFIKNEPLPESAFSQYERLAGEQEARATQAALEHPDLEPYAALRKKEKRLPEPIVKMDEAASGSMSREKPMYDGDASLPTVKGLKEIKKIDGFSSQGFKQPLHLPNGDRISGYNDAERTVLYGYDKNGEVFTIGRKELDDQFKSGTGIFKSDRDKNLDKWFGDSKVVDESGKPKAVYHGTLDNFDAFDHTKGENSQFGRGMYFTSSPKDAGRYASKDVSENFDIPAKAEWLQKEYGMDYKEARDYVTKGNGNIMPVYLKIENPLVLGEETVKATKQHVETAMKWSGVERPEYAAKLFMIADEVARSNGDKVAAVFDISAKYDVNAYSVDRLFKRFNYDLVKAQNSVMPDSGYRELMISQGKDGIILKNVKDRFSWFEDGSEHYFVRTPEQIKSIHNSGSFSHMNPNILQSNPIEALRFIAEEIPLSVMNGFDWTVRKIQKALLKGKTLDEVLGDMLKAESDNELIDTIKKAVVQDYRLSDQYLALADQAQIAIKKGEAEAHKIFEMLKDIPEDDLTKVHDFVAGETNAIPEAYSALAQAAKRAIKAKTHELVSLGLLPEDILRAYQDGYVHREYAKHIKRAVADMFFNNQKKLAAGYKRGKTETISSADYDALVEAGEVGDSIRTHKYVFEGRTPTGKVKVRRDWTKAEREEMGEVTNAAFTVPNTIVKLQRDIAYGNFLSQVATDPALRDSVKTADDLAEYLGVASAKDIPESGTGFVKLSGRQFGKLDGMYVEEAVANDIKGFKSSLFGDDRQVFEAWKTFLGEWKVAKTIKNPTAHMNNFLSNAVMSYYAGIKPSDVGKNMAGAINEIRTKGRYFKEAEEVGLFGRSKLEDIRRLVDVPTQKVRGAASKVARNVYLSEDSKLGSAAFKLYELEDDVARLSLFMHYRKQGMTQREAMKAAGQVVFDYTKRMPPLLRGLRDSGLVPFVSWTYKSLPLMFNTLFQRPSRYAAAVGAYVLVDEMINGDSEKPEFMRGKYITVNRSGKESQQLRIASMTPYFDWFTEPTEALKQQMIGGVPLKPVEFATGRQLWNDQKITYRDGGEAVLDYGLWTANNVLPTPAYLSKVYNVGEAIANDGRQPKRNKLFKPRSTAEAAAGLFGFNVRTYDQAEQRKRDREKARKELKKK